MVGWGDKSVIAPGKPQGNMYSSGRQSSAGTSGKGGKGRASYYVLRLYVAGASMRSANAIANIQQICEERLTGHYRLEVIDIYQQPQMAAVDQIFAAPTLLKRGPLPIRRIVGDFSNADRVMAGLNLGAASPARGGRGGSQAG